jgi:hypothetical protein
MFQEALQLKDVIILLQNNKQNIVKINRRMLLLFISQILKIIVDSFAFVVSACDLNQSSSHWLLFNAL